MATLDGWRGALLVESVGSGKTWIALAVAACERGPVLAVVPAILRAQWADAAARADVRLQIWTHERASRGALPPIRPSLVIIDEAHRFRDPATRRTQTIAPWIVGRRTLLLTATPIVNRLADLITLLRLILPEDALTLDDIPRLGDMEFLSTPPCALRRIAIRSPVRVRAAIDRRTAVLQPTKAELFRTEQVVAAINGLALSNSTPIRRLLTSVLLDAAASSDAAFQRALRRYRALLLQARDAGGVSRAMLRRFAGESLEQLVFWSLLPSDDGPSDLPLADIARVEQLLSVSPNDAPWIDALMRHCTDQRPTICFTRHRATARVLRMTLGDGTAWITGAEAGIGPHRMPREMLLAAFGPNRSSWQARRHVPQVLIATDVAAEGLDLQAAGRIVHVDLPWTATRLEQREGRLLRLGQRHADVEVLVRLPAPAIEAALAPGARVRRKRGLADVWLQALEIDDETASTLPPGPLFAANEAATSDVGEFTIQLARDGRTGISVITQSVTGDWGRDIAAAARMAISRCTAHDSGSRILVNRIHRLARLAASRRDGPGLQRLDRLLRFAAASPTLGMRLIVARLADGSDRELLQADVPDVVVPGAISATGVAAILPAMASAELQS